MRLLSSNDIAALAKQAGFPDAAIPTAVAIALAESSGNADAHNPRPPDDSYGLWQINMIGNLLSARLKEFGITSAAQLFDPLINARAAHAVFADAGQKFTPWSTYTSGAYQKYMPTNLPVIGNAVASVPGLSALPYAGYIVPGLSILLAYLLFAGGDKKQ